MRHRPSPRRRPKPAARKRIAHPLPPIAPLWEVLQAMIGKKHGAHLEHIFEAAVQTVTGRTPHSDPFGMDTAFLDLLRPFFEFLYSVYFRVEVNGIANVPIQEPAILVANHSGALPYDGVMLHLAIYNEHAYHRLARFLVEDFVFRVPLLSRCIQKAGGVRACHENATALLERGDLVIVFPEGVRGISKTYDQRYRLDRFGRGGFVRLAMRTGTPIIPVAIVGAEEIHPIIWKSVSLARPFGLPFIPFTPTFPWLGPLGLLPLPSKWRIAFGAPISCERFRPDDADDDALVGKMTERTKTAVQRLIDGILRRRKSIWI